MNYQFLQFFPKSGIILIDVSGKVAGPTMDTSGKKPSLWIFSQSMKEALWGS